MRNCFYVLKDSMRLTMALLVVVSCLLGAITAGRQSWLQWNPPEMASCGRDLYSIIESVPLKHIIPMIFRGGGDCVAVDWTLLGMTIANWSFISFLIFGLTMLALVVSGRGEPQVADRRH